MKTGLLVIAWLLTILVVFGNGAKLMQCLTKGTPTRVYLCDGDDHYCCWKEEDGESGCCKALDDAGNGFCGEAFLCAGQTMNGR